MVSIDSFLAFCYPNLLRSPGQKGIRVPHTAWRLTSLVSEKFGRERIAFCRTSSRQFRPSNTATTRCGQPHLCLITAMLVVSLFIAYFGALADARDTPTDTPRVAG